MNIFGIYLKQFTITMENRCERFRVKDPVSVVVVLEQLYRRHCYRALLYKFL